MTIKVDGKPYYNVSNVQNEEYKYLVTYQCDGELQTLFTNEIHMDAIHIYLADTVVGVITNIKIWKES